MSGRRVQVRGGSACIICDALRLPSFTLTCCLCGTGLAVALAEMLDNNMHLTSLGLEWNSIGMFESGMQRLCQSIARNSSLTELDLRNNGISSYGGALLGEMLTKSSSLKRIDLRWNNLGASGGKSLLDGLQRNGSVIELMLTGNKVSDETLRAVEQCLIKVSGGWFRSISLAFCSFEWLHAVWMMICVCTRALHARILTLIPHAEPRPEG